MNKKLRVLLKNAISPIWTSIMIIAVSSIGCGVLSFYFRQTNQWLSGVLVNLSSGLAVIVITVIFIDKLLQSQENKKRQKVEKCALRIIGEVLDRYLEFILSFKNDTGKNIYYDIKLSFDENYYKIMSKFDFSTKSQHISGYNWYYFMHYNRNNLCNGLNNILDRYTSFLDKEFIILIEDLKKSSQYLPPIPVRYIFNQEILKDYKNHINKLMSTLDYYNSKVSDSEKIIKVQVTSYKAKASKN